MNLPGRMPVYQGSWCAAPRSRSCSSSAAPRRTALLPQLSSAGHIFSHRARSSFANHASRRRESLDASSGSRSEFSLGKTAAQPGRHKPRRTAPTSTASPSVKRPPASRQRPASATAAPSRSGLQSAGGGTARGAVQLPQRGSPDHGILGLQPGQPQARDFATDNAQHALGRPTSAPVFRTAQDLADRSSPQLNSRPRVVGGGSFTAPVSSSPMSGWNGSGVSPSHGLGSRSPPSAQAMDQAIFKTVQTERTQRRGESQSQLRSFALHRVGDSRSAPDLDLGAGGAALTGRQLRTGELEALEHGAHLSPSRARPCIAADEIVVVLDRDPAMGYGLDLRVGMLEPGLIDGNHARTSGARLLVAKVRTGTPASAADLQPGDEVVGAAVVSAGGRELRPLEVGAAFADAGLSVIRQACGQAHRMRWTVHRLAPGAAAEERNSGAGGRCGYTSGAAGSRTGEETLRAAAWREQLRSPDAPADESEKETTLEAEKENPSGEDLFRAPTTDGIENLLAGGGRLGPITAGTRGVKVYNFVLKMMDFALR